MNRMISVLLCLILLLAAASAVGAKATISMDPLGILSNQVVAVDYETDAMFGPAQTLVVHGRFWNTGLGIGARMRAAGFGAGMRFYLDGEAHEGVYLGGSASVTRLTGFDYPGHPVGGSVITIIGTGGYKWNFPNGLVVDVGAEMDVPVSSRVNQAGYYPVLPEHLENALGTMLRTSVGYTF